MRYIRENSNVVSAMPPEGTFYAWVDVSRSGMDGKRAARLALEEAKVGVMPGYLFGDAGRNHVRISFATSDDIVDQGMRKFCAVLAGKKAGRKDEEGKVMEKELASA